MIFAEPTSVWHARDDEHRRECSNFLNSPLRFEGVWDYAIIEEVKRQGDPLPIMSLVSQLRKRHRHRNKQDKESTKRTILLRICALIRQKELQRVRRKFVTMPK